MTKKQTKRTPKQTKKGRKPSKATKLLAHPYGVEVAIVNSTERFEALGRELDVPADDITEMLLCDPAGITVRLRSTLCVGVFDADLATLVHELVHVGVRILQRAGIKPTHANGEPLAYLVENLYARAIAAGFKP